MTIDLLDEKHAKLYQEIQDCLNEDEEEEVFIFDHIGGRNEIHTRTAIISWDIEEFLVIQSHYWLDESDPVTIRLPHSAIKFMCDDILARSIKVNAFKVSPNGFVKMKHKGWIE